MPSFCLPLSSPLPKQVAYIISVCALPSEFAGIFSEEPERVVKNW